MRKIIISVAPVAGSSPVEPDKLAADVILSSRAGASLCHLHCKARSGELTPDTRVLIESFEKIRSGSDIVIQASTGGVSNMTIQERCKPLAYWRVESASLNVGSCNLGEAVYINPLQDVRYCTKQVYEQGIIPEIEVFELGMIQTVLDLEKEIPFRKPILFNLVFGHKGIMVPDTAHLAAFWNMVPKRDDVLWGVTHYGRDNWTFLAAAIAMGASLVRVGFEDSYYLEPGVMATHNFQIVERLAALIRAMGLEVATPDETREILAIPERRRP